MQEKLNVGELCNRVVVYATEDMSLKDAARLMRDDHVGSLVVVREADEGRVVIGMLTDRDITIMGVARDFDPQSLRVGDIMSGTPVVAHEDDSVHEVLASMRGHGIRRIPVVTDNNVLVGLITLDDLLDVMAEEMRGFVQAIESERRQESRVRG